MPDSGSTPNKSFSRAVNVYTGSDAWQQLDNAGRLILAEDQDFEGNDVADALNNRLMKDGGNLNADIPMNSNKFTGVENAAARDQFAAAGQVQDSTLVFAGTSAGTDTITATLAPAITAYVAGQRYHFKAGGTNTGASTINFNTVGAADLKKGPDAATALAAGDITTGGMYTVEYTGTVFQLLNPKFPVGFATTDTPQFTAINIGHATDTTLSRASAGDLQIEANIIYRAGGTDVAIADGGTGAGTAADAFTALKQAASDTATGVLEIAVQSEMQTGTDTGRAVTPGRQHFHPSAAKFWAYINFPGAVAAAAASYNVTSVTDNALAEVLVTIATDFSTANWSCSVTCDSPSSTERYGCVESRAAGTVVVNAVNDAGSDTDPPDAYNVVGFGALA